MNVKTGYAIFMAMLLCNVLSAQNKIIEIKTNFDLDVRYLPTRREPMSFYVHYINQPEPNQTHYTITFKPKGVTKYSQDTIFLKSPIDVEAMRQQLNKKLQILGDTDFRAISNNTIYDMAYILDTIPRPITERSIAGNLILSNYIKTFNNATSQENHKIRQEWIQNRTQNLTRTIVKAEYLLLTKSALDSNISQKYRSLSEVEYKIRNIDRIRQQREDIVKLNLATSKKNVEDSSNIAIDIESKEITIQQKAGTIDQLKSHLKSLDNVRENLKEVTDGKPVEDKVKEHLSQLKTIKNGVISNEVIYDLKKFENQSAEKDAIKDIINLITAEETKANSIINELEESIEHEMKTIDDQKARMSVVKSNLSELNKKIADNIQSIRELNLRELNIEKIRVSNQIKVADSTTNSIKSQLAALNSVIKTETESLEAESIFQINKVSLQIERGFIERIQVYIPGKNSDKYDIYENIFAIGFSSIKNYKSFTSTKLYSRLSKDEHVFLSDVIANFDNLLENYTRDYSPADTTINHVEPKQGFVRLNREQFANLFDARVYTDLIGIRNDRPNGLIQVDIARKFNILTSRNQVHKTRSDWGSFTYITVFGSLSKIENNKKYLPLRNENIASQGQLLSPYYATNLDFRLYQNFSLGAELNLFLFDYPDGKITGYIDIGSTYGQTPLTFLRRTIVGNVVSQSERDSSLVAHSATFYPKLTLEIFSEKRVRLNMSYQFNTTRLYSNNNFKAIASYAKSDLLDRATEAHARRSHMLEVNLTASPTNSKDGRFFFRARYFIQSRDNNTFFSQIQFGYTYNLRLKKFE